jgi:hypothetical protein
MKTDLNEIEIYDVSMINFSELTRYNGSTLVPCWLPPSVNDELRDKAVYELHRLHGLLVLYASSTTFKKFFPYMTDEIGKLFVELKLSIVEHKLVGLSYEEIDKLKYLIDWVESLSQVRFDYDIALLKRKNT